MKIYRVDDTHKQCFAPTMTDAVKAAREGLQTPDGGRHVFSKFDVMIELVEVPTDLRSIVSILNGMEGELKVLRRWEPGQRGGFKELPCS